MEDVSAKLPLNQTSNLDDNRFKRAYLEHRREKEIERDRIQPNYNNRFACLKDNNVAPPRRDAGRFECLRGPSNYSDQDTRVINRESNRFSCLAGDSYESYPRQETARTTYLPRPEPRESVNEQARRYKEEKKALAPPPPPPPMTFESAYHFPELGKEQEAPTNSKLPKPKQEVKLPEPKAPIDMIVNPIVTNVKKEKVLILSYKDGKVIQKEMYIDGTEINEDKPVIIKKPTYTSWASVLKKPEPKPEPELHSYYDQDDNEYSDFSSEDT
jgi:hypothetical protein